MPIYEYQCTGCKHHFDLIQKINDAPVKTCPGCHADSVVRLVSAAGFQLKGSGWYATDFKTKKSEIASDSTSTTDKPDTGSNKADTSGETTTTSGSET